MILLTGFHSIAWLHAAQIKKKLADDRNNVIYFFGPSLKGKNKYYDDLKKTRTYDGFQIMKVRDHKIEYLKYYSLDELDRKIVRSPGQKKAKPYDGKRMLLSTATLTPNKKLMIIGQNWKYQETFSQDIQKSKLKAMYYDCFGLAFDESGNFLAQYLSETKCDMDAGEDFAKFQILLPGKEPDHVYWLLINPHYWSWESYAGTKIYDERPSEPEDMNDIIFTYGIGNFFTPYSVRYKCDLVSSECAGIDLQNDALSEFTKYQEDKENKISYYLYPRKPYYLTKDHELILFGVQAKTKGKVLWFSRISLE